MDLMEKFCDKGYVLFTENYYSSVPLFQDLSSQGTLACGTVRSNRKGLPKDITNTHSGEVKGISIFLLRLFNKQCPTKPSLVRSFFKILDNHHLFDFKVSPRV